MFFYPSVLIMRTYECWPKPIRVLQTCFFINKKAYTQNQKRLNILFIYLFIKKGKLSQIYLQFLTQPGLRNEGVKCPKRTVTAKKKGDYLEEKTRFRTCQYTNIASQPVSVASAYHTGFVRQMTRVRFLWVGQKTSIADFTRLTHQSRKENGEVLRSAYLILQNSVEEQSIIT